MDRLRKLPDAEFEIMKVVWVNEPPITTNLVMDQLGTEKGWKAPTIISLMSRLVERGFLNTEKNGKERTYSAQIRKEDYLKFETENFMEQYHGNSFSSFVNALYEGKAIQEQDIDDLLKWVKDRRK